MRIWFPLLIVIGLLLWQFVDVTITTPTAKQANVQAGAATAGLPVSVNNAPLTIIQNTGFSLGYSEQRKNPLWVTFELQAVSAGKLPRRPHFERDARSRAGVDQRDLYGSGYDRGHMAPNYAMAKLYGLQAQRQSFLMTNISPQLPRLNQLLWQRIEEAEVDYMAKRWQTLWVTTGPVFDTKQALLRSGIEIPDAFYRLWLDQTDAGELRVLALLVPQDVRGDESLSQFITTVDHIEALTGLDFYPQLTQAAQLQLESQPADKSAWAFQAIACLPARYADDWQDKNGIRLRYDRCH